MKKLLWVLSAALSIPVTSLAEGNNSMHNTNKVSHYVDELAESSGPGIQYVVVDKNGVVFERCAGLAHVNSRVPLTQAHTMAAFSMTKTITAIATLQLIEENRLSLDDTAARYVEHPYNQAITIRHLLNHTSGIPNPIPLKWVHLTEEHGDFDEGKALTFVLRKYSRSKGVPGERYGYSNIGYWLLGKITEAATNRGYEEYITENLFQPLDLKPGEIGFQIYDSSTHARGYLSKYSLMNLVKMFVTDDEIWGEYEDAWLRVRDVYLNGPSFGGVVGCARAFSRLLQDLLSEKSTLLGSKARHLLYFEQTNNAGERIDMTLGWHVGVLNGETYFYKEGGGAGFHCEMRVYPSEGFASVIMTNKTSFNSRRHLSDIDTHFFK